MGRATYDETTTARGGSGPKGMTVKLRNIVLAAAVAAPLMWSSTPISAQQRGLERAATATAQAESVAGWTNGNGVERGPSEMPKGIVRRFVDGLTNVLPPGIRRMFPETAPTPEPEPEPEPQPEPEPEPQPEPEPCMTTLVYVNGVPMLRDCNGNLTPLFGG